MKQLLFGDSDAFFCMLGVHFVWLPGWDYVLEVQTFKAEHLEDPAFSIYKHTEKESLRVKISNIILCGQPTEFYPQNLPSRGRLPSFLRDALDGLAEDYPYTLEFWNKE